jgi:hypothetical protein
MNRRIFKDLARQECCPIASTHVTEASDID